MRICNWWASDHLAFVNTSVIFEDNASLGRKNLLVVLEKEENEWRLVTVGTYIKVIEILQEWLPESELFFEEKRLQMPAHISPPDMARFANRLPASTRPEIVWANAGSTAVLYLVEHQYGWGRSPMTWSEGMFNGFPAESWGEGVIKVTAPFGVGRQPHRWRVWALDSDGSFMVNDWRTLIYTR